MFIDYTKVKVKAGNGGNGAISFHREKQVAGMYPDVKRWKEAQIRVYKSPQDA